MADLEYSHRVGERGADTDGYAQDEPATAALTTWTNAAGAVVSLALIAGVGVWGYDLMMRDVSGLPVVRAATTEMRVRPEDPGGQLAEHQGLAVNEIAAHGAAAGPVDKVVLAPPEVTLSPEDQPVTRPAEPVVQPAPLAPAMDAFEPDAVIEAAVQPLEAEPEQSEKAVIDEVVAALMAEAAETPARATGPKVVQARAAAVQDAAVIAQPAVLVTDAVEEDAGSGLPRSVRPKMRPGNGQAFVQQAAFVPEAETREIDPDAIPSGTRLAQLGAFESPDVARAEWVRMESNLGEILDGKSRVIQQAQSGGRTFYRLRAMGFVDVSDTRRFCSAVKAEGVDCIPVEAK